MSSILTNVLENLNLSQEYDVILQGTLDSTDERPSNYFTFWCWDNARSGYYDNKHTVNYVGYQIVAYSTDPSFVEEMITRAKEELEKNKFELDEDETDYHSSQKNYTAKMIDVYYTKKKGD